MGTKLLVAFPFPGRSQRGLLRSYALGMLLHTRASLHHAWHKQEGASLGFFSSPPRLMEKDYSKLANSQKKLGSVGFLQSNQLTVELEQTAHPDRGTGPPHGCIAAAALLGCQVIPGTVGMEGPGGTQVLTRSLHTPSPGSHRNGITCCCSARLSKGPGSGIVHMCFSLEQQ